MDALAVHATLGHHATRTSQEHFEQSWVDVSRVCSDIYALPCQPVYMTRMYLIAKSVLATSRHHLEAFSNEALRTAVDDSTVMRSLRFRAGCTFQPTGAQARSKREKRQGAAE